MFAGGQFSNFYAKHFSEEHVLHIKTVCEELLFFHNVYKPSSEISACDWSVSKPV